MGPAVITVTLHAFELILVGIALLVAALVYLARRI
jgi:hypothetical protein